MRHARELRQDGVGLFIDACACIEQHADQVGVVGSTPGGRDHGAIEPPLRREDAGRIDQNDLGVVFDDDAADECSGGLHLARDDRDFRADQRVDESGLADIGRSYQRNETAPGRRAGLAHFTPSRAIIADAAAFSAARLLPPTPSEASSPGNSTATRKRGS